MRIALHNLHECSIIALLLCGTVSAQLATAKEKPEQHTAQTTSDSQSTQYISQTGQAPSEAGKGAVDDSMPWHFQRLLVPVDRVEDWPRPASGHFLPIRADEFEQRLAQIGKAGWSRGQSAQAQLIRAIYSAELVGNTLRGKSEWTFEHSGSAPDLAPLGDCQLSLSNFHWIGSAPSAGGSRDQVDGNGQTAIVGNDHNGELAALVDRAGTMEGLWSLYGEREAEGTLSFDFQLPACAVNQLDLTLPSDLMPIVNAGKISNIGTTANNKRRWQIDLGGNQRTVIRIAKRDTPLSETVKTFVRESFVYEFSPNGLQLTARFQLDLPGKPPKTIKLRMDRPLTLAKASLGEHKVPVSLVNAGSDGQSTVQEVELELPDLISGSTTTLQLTAIAPIIYGKPWHLPLIHVKDSNWQTGSARLFVSKSLVVDELRTDDCRQSGVESLSGSTLGDTIQLTLFNEHPVIEIALSHQREQLKVSQGTSIFLRANEGTGHFLGDFELDQGECFLLEADVAPQWIIEDVESATPEDISDWSQHSDLRSGNRLTVQLSTPLTTKHAIRLSIKGRRRSAPWGETMHANDLAMLNFAEAIVSRRIVQVEAAETYRLQIRDAAKLTRLDAAKLSQADAALLDEKSTGLVFVDDKNAQNLAVSLTGKAPQYDAEIQSEALVGDDRLTESYRFRIAPQGREVGRFNVRFSQLRSTPITWSLEGEPAAAVTARRLTEAEGSLLAWPGDVWEVIVSTPRSTPLVLRASRSTPLVDDMPLALASLLDAETQRGTIQITSTAKSLPEIHSRRLKTIPVEAPGINEYETTLAAFRYDPEEDTLLTAEPPLVLAPYGNRIPLARAWIWEAKLDSRYSRSGVENTLTCNVESAGQETIDFQPAADAQLQSISVNGYQAVDSVMDAGSWKIKLPAGERFSNVVLHWNNRQGMHGLIASCDAPWPVISVPVLSHQWQIWLPPSMSLMDIQVGKYRPFEVSWTRRLFGPLARAEDLSAARLVENRPQAQSTLETDQRSSKSTNAYSTAATEVNRAGSQPMGLRSPWDDSLDELSDGSNWICYRYAGSGAADQIWIADKQSLWAWSWSVFMIAVAAGWRLGNRPRTVDVGLFGIATVTALLIPAPWSPLTAAIWLGLVGGRLMAWLNQWLTKREAVVASPAASNSVGSELATAMLLLILVVTLIDRGFAQADEQTVRSRQADSPKPPVWQVLVPVDHEDQPAGDLYYLPETFHKELLRLTSAKPITPQYLITKATYAALGKQNTMSSELDDGNWEAAYEIDSLVDHAEVRLSLGFDGAAIVPGGIKVDGQPAAFRSDTLLHNLIVELESKGPHQLMVVLHPAVNLKGLNIVIPKIANSQINLSGIDTSKYKLEASFSKAVEIVHTESAGHELVELGPADRIILRAAESAPEAAAAAVFDVDEIYWLRMHRDSVAVDARFNLNIQSGSVQQLYLNADRHWRPNSMTEAKPAQPAATADHVNGGTAQAELATEVAEIAQVHPMLSNPNTWVIELARPVTAKATVDVSFHLESDSGIGRWEVPEWKLSGARAEHRWCGVTVGQDLEFTVLPAPSSRRISADEFSRMWPTSSTQPQIAWNLDANEASRSISIWPREPKLSVGYQLAAIAGLKEIDLRLAAHINVKDGQAFQYRLHVPAKMEIDSVSVLDQNDIQPSRWSRSRPDLMTAFLAAPVQGERDLLVCGRMPIPSDARFALPNMSIDGSTLQSFRAMIFRRSDVLVNLSDLTDLRAVPEAGFAAAIAEYRRQGLLEPVEKDLPERPDSEHGRLVAILDADREFQPAALQIEQNQPQTRVLQVAMLSRNADSWLAKLHVDLKIESGVLDELRFDLPANWIGPFEVLPAVSSSVEEVIGENRKQLVLRPEKPLKGNIRLQISGPLAITAGQRPSAPDVRVVGAIRQTRFFLLPRRLENEQLAWDTRGLVPRTLPEAIADLVTDASSYRVYQLVGERCRADLRSIERSNENAQVRLADVEWSWDGNGDYRGVAGFDVDPAGATSCELQMLATQRLVQVQLDATPAQLSAVSENQWNVWLGDSKLPRHLEVIFAGNQTETIGDQFRLTAPTVVDMPVERTLWSVWSPNGAGGVTVPAGQGISLFQHRRLRFENAAASLDAANGLILEESTDDLARWHIPWLRRFSADRAELTAARSAESSEEEKRDIDSELNAIDQEETKLAGKLNIENHDGEMPNGLVAGASWLQLVQRAPPGHRETFAMARGGGGPLVVGYTQQRNSENGWRYVVAAAVGLFSIGLILALRFTWLGDVRMAYGPQLLGLVTGLIWWLWLSPALVGIGILAISVFYLWKSIGQRTVADLAAG